MDDMQVAKHSPVVQALSRIEQLPDDILLIIISFLPTLADMAATSVLCRKWRNMWYGITCLNFDATALLREEGILRTMQEWYIMWVNKTIDARDSLPGLPPVKELLIQYNLSTSHRFHIKRWICYAIANRVETLRLDFGPLSPRQYKLSEKYWKRAPSGRSSLDCLKSLSLVEVSVTKQFIEFILSNCPLLEDLELYRCGAAYKNLDVSGAHRPLRLRRLKMDVLEDYVINKLCAPHLTSLFYKSRKFNPHKIDVPLLNDLSIGGFVASSQPVMKYIEHFQRYLPQLEKLYLIMEHDREFVLKPIPELAKLKYLMISFTLSTNSYFYEIINFISACSSLETFAFQVRFRLPRPSPLHQYFREKQWKRIDPCCSFDSLKTLKLYGGDGGTIYQHIIAFIIDKSPNLKKLIIEIRSTLPYQKLSNPEIIEVVKAKAKELCDGKPHEVEITVTG